MAVTKSQKMLEIKKDSDMKSCADVSKNDGVREKADIGAERSDVDGEGSNAETKKNDVDKGVDVHEDADGGKGY